MRRRRTPWKVIEPRWGWYTPFKTFKSELLPAPLGPMIAQISPRRTSRLTPERAVTPPKESVTSSTFSRTSPIRFGTFIPKAAFVTEGKACGSSGLVDIAGDGEGPRRLRRAPDAGAQSAEFFLHPDVSPIQM